MSTRVAPTSSTLPTSRGEPHPLGATVREGGVNFSIFSRRATAIELLLFDRFDDPQPRQVIRLDSRHHRTFSYWHTFVHGVTAGQLYAYRVHGPWAPSEGHRFNPNKVLLDPYARGIVSADGVTHDEACHEGPNVASAMKSLVVDPSSFDWQGVTAPRVEPGQRVIYEMHVRGFTRHPSSGVQYPGTFRGLIDKIPYLVDLGVTTVELLPVFAFDEHENRFFDPTTGTRLTNYWGYSPLGFFAPHRGYYIENWTNMRYLTGFRDVVRELHRAGIEVFLDVVFNHTSESGIDGPTHSFRGIENSVYYMLDPEDRSEYANFSGVGNTFNCNHPIVRRLILDSLRYWVEVMHVDGFRFDLASILSRDEAGTPMPDPPLPWEIEADPVLQRVQLIAEAWDAGGLYQVGEFPGERWSEWNGKFRDDVRRFVRGDHGMTGSMAARVLGSPDLYEHHGREAHQCVNFVTCHDGFTLNDLVSYSRKHNEANGEQNKDGSDLNFSANYGHEGPSDDPEIERIRNRHIKNLLTILFISQGTPMLLGGDEFRRTQQGNNNAYCQDNEVSWHDWRMLETHADIHRFTKQLIRFRAAHPSLRRRKYLLGVEAASHLDPPGHTRVHWHGVEVNRPDWSSASRTLAFTLTKSPDDQAIHVILNMHDETLTFHLPPPPDHERWFRVIDTAQPSPEDFIDPPSSAQPARIEVGDRSVIVLVAR